MVEPKYLYRNCVRVQRMFSQPIQHLIELQPMRAGDCPGPHPPVALQGFLTRPYVLAFLDAVGRMLSSAYEPQRQAKIYFANPLGREGCICSSAFHRRLESYIPVPYRANI